MLSMFNSDFMNRAGEYIEFYNIQELIEYQLWKNIPGVDPALPESGPNSDPGKLSTALRIANLRKRPLQLIE